MDDELYQRYLQGDANAVTGVRNHLRAIASRVLGAPQWRLDDLARRRVMEQKVTEDAMAVKQPDLVTAAARLMVHATATGIASLRLSEALPQGHVDTKLLASMAMQTLAAHEQDPVEAHLSTCHTCRRHLSVAETALRAAVSAQKTTPTLALKPQSTPVARQPAPASPAPAKAPRRRVATEKSSSLWVRLLPVVALAVGLGIYWKDRQPDATSLSNLEIAQLLPRELPPTAQAKTLDHVAEEAVIAMARGRCGYASRRLELALRDKPQGMWLHYYKGLAHLCSREGSEAHHHLAWVEDNSEYPPFGLYWWLGQARLLDGQIERGLATLDALGQEDHPRAPYARELARKVRGLD